MTDTATLSDDRRAEARRLREMAAWYRALADRAGNPMIWDARLRTAEDLEAEADRSERRDQMAAFQRSYIKRDAAQTRSYSPAVITEGGRTIWLAGQVALEDSTGRSLAADFDGQVREVFARLGRTLEEAGATLADMVTMTVFVTDARFNDRFIQLRHQIFGDNFPASALVTCAALARPGLLVEVQGVAVAK